MKFLVKVIAVEVFGCVALAIWLKYEFEQNKRDAERINTLKNCLERLETLKFNEVTNQYKYTVIGKA